MPFDRRQLLSGLAAGVAAGAVLPFRPVLAEAAASPRPLLRTDGEVDWEAVRAEFDLAPDWIHLSSFFLVSHPRPVREAIERYRREIDADPLWLEEVLFEAGGKDPFTRVKAALASYVGGNPAEIALTSNTTTGLALIYNGLRLRAGQEILTTEHDHYSHHESIHHAAEKAGAKMRFIALHDGAASASEGEMVERLRRAIGPRTRAVGITWVHSSSGLRLPLRAFAEVVAAANRGRAADDRCLLVVDGAHGLAAVDEEPARSGVDFLVAGTHKWLFGPRGTGMIWGKADAWPHVRPTVPSFDLNGAAELWFAWTERRPLPPTRAAFVSPGGFVAYEHAFAVAEAVEFHQRLGRARVAARIAELNGRFRAELSKMKRVRVITPLDPKLAAGLVCFEIEGLQPNTVVARLKEKRIRASSSPYKISYARVSAGIMVSPGEVETTLAAIRTLARA